MPHPFNSVVLSCIRLLLFLLLHFEIIEDSFLFVFVFNWVDMNLHKNSGDFSWEEACGCGSCVVYIENKASKTLSRIDGLWQIIYPCWQAEVYLFFLINIEKHQLGDHCYSVIQNGWVGQRCKFYHK